MAVGIDVSFNNNRYVFFKHVFITSSQDIDILSDDSALIRAGITETWLPIFYVSSTVLGWGVIGVGNFTKVLGVVRRSVVGVWPIAFVIQSKVRFLVVRHGCIAVCRIDILRLFWKGDPSCCVFNVNCLAGVLVVVWATLICKCSKVIFWGGGFT